MALKGWSCPSTGWTGQSWSVRGRCASSNSLKRFCSYWMWKMQSSTWISLSWAFSSSSYGWPPTWSSATRSSLSDRFRSAHLPILTPSLMSLQTWSHFLCKENNLSHVGIHFISFFILLLRGQNINLPTAVEGSDWRCRAVKSYLINQHIPVLPQTSELNSCTQARTQEEEDTETEPHSAAYTVCLIFLQDRNIFRTRWTWEAHQSCEACLFCTVCCHSVSGGVFRLRSTKLPHLENQIQTVFTLIY